MHTVCVCALWFLVVSLGLSDSNECMGSGIMVSDMNIGNPDEGTQPLSRSQQNASGIQNVPILQSRGKVMSP